MSKPVVWTIVGVIALCASIWMYQEGQSNGHLEELQDFWFYPLPLAFIAFQIAYKQKQNAAQASKKQDEASPG